MCRLTTLLLIILPFQFIKFSHVTKNNYLNTNMEPNKEGLDCLTKLQIDGSEHKCMNEGQTLFNKSGKSDNQTILCEIVLKSAQCMTEVVCDQCNRTQTGQLLDWQDTILAMMAQGECRSVPDYAATIGLHCPQFHQIAALISVLMLAILIMIILAATVLWYIHNMENNEDQAWAAMAGDGESTLKLIPMIKRQANYKNEKNSETNDNKKQRGNYRTDTIGRDYYEHDQNSLYYDMANFNKSIE